MSKGDETRQAILAQAARTFSIYGFGGASMQNLMDATQLTKGGIYNHFGSKEALALEALNYAVYLVMERFRAMAGGLRDTRARLLAVVQLFRSLIDDPLFPGGCLMLNTAIETDDGDRDSDSALRARAQQALDEWRDYITRTLSKGRQLGTVRGGVDSEIVASVIIATLEGGIMLSKLYDDNRHMARVAEHLTDYIDSLVL